MRADAVMPKSAVNWKRLTDLLDRAMNHDPHPAVRAWATKAAWQWWVWNPPVRAAVNDAWVQRLLRPESNTLVENCLRYSSHALFIANGHKANGSTQHQYKELAALFAALTKQLDSDDAALTARLGQRLVGIGATFFQTSGGDGGPGQMGYVTPGAGELMGKAALAYLEDGVQRKELDQVRLGLEGAAGVPYQPLTSFLVDYSLNGPDALRQLAANAVSDPRSVKLAAVPELIQPQLAQVLRGAAEPPRRPQISDPILNLWAKVNWVVPKTEEQQKNFFDLLIPKLDRYSSPVEVAALTDPARRAESERQMDAAWYLADRLGNVLQTNPDLHQDIVFRAYFPKAVRNPLEAHFWLASVGWLLTHRAGMPSAAAPGNPRQPDQPSADLTIKDRALQLYLDQLRPEARAETRAVAIKMANQTALRSNPEVLVALGKVLTFEKDKELRKIATNVLNQGTSKFLPEVLAVLKTEKDPSVRLEKDGTPRPTKEQLDDIVYFRDYVVPELTRQKRDDQKSCLGCHGVPGRVPSMTLRPADDFGYMPVPDLLTNYRLLQKRVDLAHPEKSKLLRKPLNIQDGQEDGHQGGRRYTPSDEGYLVLKRWAENQQRVQRAVKAP
jgi:hypothetical protein